MVAAYQGVELIGITAGEARDPKNTLTKAIQSIIWRISKNEDEMPCGGLVK